MNTTSKELQTQIDLMEKEITQLEQIAGLLNEKDMLQKKIESLEEELHRLYEEFLRLQWHESDQDLN